MQTWFALAAVVVPTLLSGAALGVILKFRLDRQRLGLDEKTQIRDTARDDFKLILEVVTKQRDEAITKVDETLERVDCCELEISGLRLAQDFDPFPNWMVDLQGRYLYVSREFERQFLRDREPSVSYRDLIGKDHNAVWPPEFARKLDQLDAEAKTRPDGRARATMAVDDRTVTVHKFPIRIRGIIVGFAGYVTQIEPLPSGALERLS